MATHSAAGGVKELWANLAEGFRGLGHDAHLYALYPAPNEPGAAADWTHVVPCRPGSLPDAARLFRRLVALLREVAPSAVFTAMPVANAAVPVAATLSRVPVRVIPSHHIPADTYGRSLARAESAAALLGSVTGVVSVSGAVGASLKRRLKRHRRKAHVVPNALPPRMEAYLDGLRAGRAGPGRRRVVAVGRLSPQKNLAVLVRAAAGMPDIVVEIAGAGPEAAALQALVVSEKVESGVRFLGHMDRESAMRLLAEGGVFAQPSLFEGHSLALIEAARLGLPLVVSDVSVQVEGITAPDGSLCGQVVGTRDAAGLAECCRGLLDDAEAYATWSERSLSLARSHSFSKMLQSYVALATDSSPP